jgi:hypothetical protein
VGHCWSSGGGAQFDCIRDISILNEIWAQSKICIFYFDRHFAWLKYFSYHLVPVLAPNYKQHILSPAKVRKVCYSLTELYVKSVYLNLFGWRGNTAFMKHCKRRCELYKFGNLWSICITLHEHEITSVKYSPCQRNF